MTNPVLYAEDDENDAFFMRRAFGKAGWAHVLHRVSDGQAAINYLAGHGPYTDRTRHPLPWLVLLDIKMPLLTGFEVLRWVRSHRTLDELPVVMVTSSNQDRDLQEAINTGANGYLLKPNNVDELIAPLHSLLSRCSQTRSPFAKRWLPFVGNHPAPPQS
jgi:CheY-like chemotaxis protein